ncbi:MAG: HAMP domain-containing sensor histidine kinase [Opitutaceae bacterium]
MSSPITSIRIIGGSGEDAVTAVNAAREAFPQALITRASELKDLLDSKAGPEAELLVLASPTPGEIDQAVAALNPRGWARWPIVAHGELRQQAASHLVVVPEEDWKEAALALAYATAIRLHALTALNGKLAGDLRMISRRLGHDIRSPLNCISTASEAMLDPTDGPESPRVKFAHSITDSVDEVIRMVDRMNFAVKATINPLPRQSLAMDEVVWGALQGLEYRLLKAGLQVHQPEKWPVVEGVPAWLEVIWSNLIANSLDHGGPQAHVHLGWEQLPDEYRFWVRDEGQGVSAKMAPLLFHPLDRLSELNAPRGLGLAIVQRLVELQGGRTGHEKAAQGSGTFYFTLPTLAA